jgi:hypothetical protein
MDGRRMISVPVVVATITVEIPLDLLMILLEFQDGSILNARIKPGIIDDRPWTMSHGPNCWPIEPSECGDIDWK